MKAHELFSDESRWTSGCFAKDSDGDVCDFDDTKAVCWCLYGGILKVYGNVIDAEDIMRKIREEINRDTIVMWNDDPSRTFREVRDLCLKLDI